ncbi:hypothetical protein [Nocardia inohanensis]|uniref:hypothetical protein n=1 Tax=Nocardia inohanensis TaxID=209246 RepID=UPI0014713B6D|nr:hypothetical protein [Nocardia inohanensis]
MGIMGELFGKKIEKDDGSDSTGEPVRPRLDLDLDAGVIRVTGKPPADPARDDD